MRAAVYTHISTADQNNELQLREILRGRQGLGDRGNLPVHHQRRHASRPGLNRLMVEAMARKFACLLVRKLDRSSKSLMDWLNSIRTVEDRAVRFIAVTQVAGHT